MEREEINKPMSRKKFVGWTAGILSVVGAASYFFFSLPRPKPKKTTTVKMLGQDGRLVEVEISKLPAKRKKIKDKDIHTWVQGKPSM